MKIEIDIHHYIHMDGDTDKILDRVFSILNKTQKQLKTIMAKIEDYQKQFDIISGALTALSNDITSLKDAVLGKGMSEADEDAALTKLTAIASTASTLAAQFSVPGPVETTPETPVVTEDPTPVVSDEPAADAVGTAEV